VARALWDVVDLASIADWGQEGLEITFGRLLRGRKGGNTVTDFPRVALDLPSPLPMTATLGPRAG
jgi:hypothetical protein